MTVTKLREHARLLHVTKKHQKADYVLSIFTVLGKLKLTWNHEATTMKLSGYAALINEGEYRQVRKVVPSQTQESEDRKNRGTYRYHQESHSSHAID